MRLRLALFTLTLALVAGSTAHAINAVSAEVTLQPNLWVLNGDPVRHPDVPAVQKLALPATSVWETVVMWPDATHPTRVAVPVRMIAEQTVTGSRTTGGQTLLVPNPTNRFDPFAGLVQLRFTNLAGTVRSNGAGRGEFGGDIPLNLRLRVALDRPDGAAATFFFVEIPSSGALTLGRQSVTATFEESVQSLSIPVEGTAFGDSWRTGTVMVSKRCLVRPVKPTRTCPVPDFTVTTMGSRGRAWLSLVTPFVIESFWDEGPQRVPVGFLGFLRLTAYGVVLPEPAGELALGAVLLGLAALAIGRRGRKTRGLLLALVVVLATGSQPAQAATITAVPDSGTFRLGETVNVDVVLGQEEGEQASMFIGVFDFAGPGAVATISLGAAGPTWPDARAQFLGRTRLNLVFHHTSPRVGGDRLLHTIKLRFNAPGQFQIFGGGAIEGFPIEIIDGDVVADFSEDIPRALLFSARVVPEPSTLLLAAIGLAILFAFARTRRARC
jgi:hypothetical protein